jgi:hypothetical protein
VYVNKEKHVSKLQPFLANCKKSLNFSAVFLTVQLGGDSDGSSNWIKHLCAVESMRNKPGQYYEMFQIKIDKDILSQSEKRNFINENMVFAKFRRVFMTFCIILAQILQLF